MRQDDLVEEILILRQRVRDLTNKVHALENSTPSFKVIECPIIMTKFDIENDPDGEIRNNIKLDIAEEFGMSLKEEGYIQYSEDTETYKDTTGSIVITGRVFVKKEG